MSQLFRTNPAHRAATFLIKFRQFTPPPTNNRSDSSVRNTLARIYDCKPNDTSSLMQILSDLWKLPHQIRAALERIDNLDATAFNHVIIDLEKVLSLLTLDTSALAIRRNIPASLESSLGMISAFLDKDHPEAMLSADSLSDLLGSVAELMQDVRDADLNKDFTDFFLHRLDELHYALNHYDILGSDAIIQKVDQIFGSLLRQYPDIRKSSKKQALAKKILGTGTAILLAIQIVNGGFELIENYKQFFITDSSNKEV